MVKNKNIVSQAFNMLTLHVLHAQLNNWKCSYCNRLFSFSIICIFHYEAWLHHELAQILTSNILPMNVWCMRFYNSMLWKTKRDQNWVHPWSQSQSWKWTTSSLRHSVRWLERCPLFFFFLFFLFVLVFISNLAHCHAVVLNAPAIQLDAPGEVCLRSGLVDTVWAWAQACTRQQWEMAWPFLESGKTSGEKWLELDSRSDAVRRFPWSSKTVSRGVLVLWPLNFVMSK